MSREPTPIYQKPVQMDTRADFQRLLEEMDRVIESKKKELVELDERLETARSQLSEQEARELQDEDKVETNLGGEDGRLDGATCDETLQDQRRLYEVQLEKFAEELGELESINQRLVVEKGSLINRLEASTTIVTRLEDELKKLSESLEEIKSANLDLNLRLAKAESESAMQQKLLRRSQDEDEVLIAAFNDKIESMKSIIDKKEEEIEQLRLENQITFGMLASETGIDNSDNVEAQNQIIPRSGTSDVRKRAIEINSAFREKDAQIELLKEHLLQASMELDKNATVIKKLSQQKRLENEGKEREAADVEQPVSSFTQIRMLESELEAKDKQLYWLEYRNHHYETVLPAMIGDLVGDLRLKLNDSSATEELSKGINTLANSIREVLTQLNQSQSLLDHIERLRMVSDLKDAQISKLVNKLNRLDAKYSLVQHKNRLLRGQSEDHERILTKSTDGQSDYETNAREIGEEVTSDLGCATRKAEDRGAILAEVRANEESDGNIVQTSPNVNQPEVAECQVLYDGNNNNPRSNCAIQPTLDKPNKTESVLELSQLVNNPSRGAAFARQTNTNCGQSLHQRSNELESPSHEERSISKPVGSHEQSSINNVISTTIPTTSIIIHDVHQVALSSINADTMATPVIATETTQTNATTISESHLESESNRTYTSSAIRVPTDEQRRLEQLENENELLELAMKEILLSIKWSDAQCSTVLIDCPSLERLCQLIEARFLAKQASSQSSSTINETLSYDIDSDSRPSLDGQRLINGEQMRETALFQLVVLKSELDLLRGQNEQLRADVKLQRKEFQHLLAQLVESSPTNTEPTTYKRVDSNDDAAGKDHSDAGGGLIPVGVNENARSEEQIDRFTESCHEESHASNHASINPDQTGLVDRIDTSCQSGSHVTTSGQCSSCSRWAKATYHLTQCIVRIEARVNLSDEAYTNRLVSLHRLIKMLERDLSNRQSLLEIKSRECHLLRQQKSMAESRLRFLDGQLTVHTQVCPLIISSYQSTNYLKAEPGKSPLPLSKLGLKACTLLGRCEVEHHNASSDRFDHRGDQAQPGSKFSQRCSSRMTISLLQSIIGCLQARLDYKDERLQELELALSNRTKTDPPVAMPRQSLCVREVLSSD